MDADNNFDLLKKTIIDALKESTLKNNIKLKYTEYVYPSEVQNDLSLTGKVPKSRELEFEEFREGLFDLISEKLGPEKATEFMNQSFQVEIGISEGEKFAPIQVSDLNDNKDTISHESGKVLMVDFWATWCGYCQDPMQENVDLMSKHPELSSKNVSIVGLSCDEGVSEWKEHVVSRNWGSIPQFIKPNCLKQFGIQGIPCIALINKSGVVAYIGHPNSIKLLETLLNLSEDKQVVYSNQDEDEEGNTKNAFWFDMDIQSKSVLVAEANFNLRDAGVINSSMVISTKYELNPQTWELTPVKATPFFFGEATQFEYDTLQTTAITFQDNYNLNGFQFKVRIIGMGEDEDF